MSADNGVYILKTAEGQYRVSHFQAVENLCYDLIRSELTSRELNSLQVVMQYEHTKFTYKRDLALTIAANIYSSLMVCEYGIKILESHKTWKELCDEAQADAKTIVDFCRDNPHIDMKTIRRISEGVIGI